MKKELKDDIKAYLKFCSQTYWADTMTSTIARRLLERLK